MSQSKHYNKNATSYTAIYDFQVSSVPSLSRVQLCVSWPQMHVLFLKKKSVWEDVVGSKHELKHWKPAPRELEEAGSKIKWMFILKFLF